MAWQALLLCNLAAVVGGALDVVAARAIVGGAVTVQLSGDSLSSITIEKPTGERHTFHMLPGSGTVLDGCTVQSARTIEGADSDGAGTASLERSWLCGHSTYHNLSSAVATTLDTFSASPLGSVHWQSLTKSESPMPWGTPIVAALGFADWTDKSSIWLGGPRSGVAPGLTYDPFAPFPVGDASLSVDAIQARNRGSVSGNGSWFVAKGYDATYNCMAGPCVKSDPPTTPTAQDCQASCEKNQACLVFAWSDRSHDCWFRTDGLWGAPGTDHRYSAVSGCKEGSDPVTGNPYVKGCGLVPPLGPDVQGPSKFYYGSADNDIAGPRMSENTASVLPMLNRIEPSLGLGLSLVQSPEDTPIVAWATAGQVGTSAGCWLNWTRAFHRLGGNAMPSNFSADLIAHGPDWRPALAWLHKQYPRFFQPDSSTHETLQRIAGTGSYADMRGTGDLDESAAQHYKELGWALNWDSSARFPWHGEWMPTPEDGFGEQWLSCFAHAPPDGHAHEPCMNVSYPEIDSWYRHINSMGQAVGTNFSSCQYGNLFEFGWNVKQAWPNKHVDCSAAAVSRSNATQLLCHTQRLLKERYGAALLFNPENSDPKSGELVCGGLDGSCIMDPHPQLPYLQHVIDMARISIAKVPSAGVCIDRQDWIGSVNPNADDRQTWLPLKTPGQFKAVRSMIFSWKPAMEAFARVWHEKGLAVIINDHSNRLDMFENVDGVFAEMGDSDADDATVTALGSLNAHAVGTALATTGPMVSYIWNHPKSQAKLTVAYVSQSLMTHMWAGVFPTIPVKNNDHAIGGDCAPACSYDAAYAAYTPIFGALRGRQWSLSANAAEVKTKNALANLFVKRQGSADIYLAPVAFAPLKGEVLLTLRLPADCNRPKLAVIAPANHSRASARLINTTTGAECDGLWSPEPMLCAHLSVEFSTSESTLKSKMQDRPASSAALVTAAC